MGAEDDEATLLAGEARATTGAGLVARFTVRRACTGFGGDGKDGMGGNGMAEMRGGRVDDRVVSTTTGGGRCSAGDGVRVCASDDGCGEGVLDGVWDDAVEGRVLFLK